MTSLRHHKLATAARATAGVGILIAGLFVAGAVTSSAPAAPQDCLPVVVGCVTTTVPTVPLPVTVPTLPTLPGTTTTTAAGGSTTSSTTTTTNPTTTTTTPPPTTTTKTTNGDATVSKGATAFKPKATVRVRGRGAHRVIEIRVSLTKAARLNALLSRKRGPIAKRLFSAKAGPHLFRFRIGRAAKPGLANLSLVYRAVTGEAARTTHRLRLPR
jgi:cytoskeletal protein RodZ